MSRKDKQVKSDDYSLLEERYSVILPMYAIKLLLKYVTTTANQDLYYRTTDIPTSDEAIMFMKLHQELTYLLVEELKKHNLDWKSIFQEVMRLSKKQDELLDIPF